jgi:hypothetical protein
VQLNKARALTNAELETGNLELGTWNLELIRRRYKLPLLLPDKECVKMARPMETETRSGPRYLASFEVRAEWDDAGGTHVLSEGITENVGPEGTLVHLPKRLPDVGSRVHLEVHSEDGTTLQVVAEVLRVERNPGHPLAALQLLGETEEWRGLIWEPAAPRVAPPPPPAEEDDEDEEEAEFAN